MPKRPQKRKRNYLTLLATVWCATAFPIVTVQAQEAGDSPSATVTLINKMVERGVLSRKDAAELIAQANADSAQAQVQIAEAQLAAARAQAAVARARAAAAVLQTLLNPGPGASSVAADSRALPPAAEAPLQAAPAPQSPAAAVPASQAAQYTPPARIQGDFDTGSAAAQAAPLPQQAPVARLPEQSDGGVIKVSDVLGDASGTAAQAQVSGAPVSAADTLVGSLPQADASAGAQGAGDQAQTTSTSAEQAPAPQPQAPVRNVPVRGDDGIASQPAPANSGDAPPSDGTVRVAYVPDVVREQITQEVKDEVLAEAHKEGWGAKVPDWVTRFDLYGDIRIRFEEIINHSTNQATGGFPNFNAINTGAPFDTTGNVYSPQYNVDQNRQRERLRARLGTVVDLTDGFTVGLRVATGNDDNPVTENQTFGAAGGAQGGDFAKYSIWLDRAYLKYQSSGDTTSNVTVTLGRFENPFFATNLIWANDLGFDGALVQLPLKVHFDDQVVDSIKPFLTAGIFPVFNTDLNFGTNQPAKFASYDKWLAAAQLGTTWKVGENFSFKTAAAMYYYVNIQGQLSDPYTPLTTSDASSTDDSRPSFAQNGNTYMAIRDIVPGPTNDNGTIDQWQYYGLATPFRDLAFTQEIDFNAFEPFKIALIAEYVQNIAYNAQSIAAVAVNNLGTAPANGSAPYIGGNKGWYVNLKFGNVVLDKGGDWNIGIGYRRVESDSVVDAFTDADFGGELTGTNLEGFTLTGSIALIHNIWFEAKWFSATAIAGPSFKNDDIQLDLNAKF